MKQYLIIYEHNEQGHIGAWVPDLPGCISFGDNMEEAEKNIREAIDLHIEGLKLEGFPVPDSTSVAGTVQIPA